jgi:hypothetical protein
MCKSTLSKDRATEFESSFVAWCLDRRTEQVLNLAGVKKCCGACEAGIGQNGEGRRGTLTPARLRAVVPKDSAQTQRAHYRPMISGER